MKNAAIHPLARKMAGICNNLHRAGLSPGRSGNVSAIHEGILWITAAGCGMGEVTPEKLLMIWPDGRVIAPEGLQLSSELAMHQAIYRQRPDIGAIVHVHPPKATALCVAHIPLDQPILSEMESTLGKIPLLPFQEPGTQALADAAADALRRSDAILLANHGVVALGEDLDTAVSRMELVESFAEIYLLARQCGNLNMLEATSP